MTVSEAIAYINNYTWSTSKMGLSRTEELLSKMGDPHRELAFVHVTGSNGKGSTCAMVAQILQEAGYRVGLYTSPYVCDFNERIRINGSNITDQDLADLTQSVAVIADAMEDHPTQFELLTAIAMAYFQREKCDLVVLEVGMGGAMDSTNVIPPPLVAALTNIGLEHTEYLGNTIEEIAKTKGGIIKKGCSCVCYDSNPDAVETIREICKDLDVPFVLAKGETASSVSLAGQCFSYQGRSYETGLLGEHQIKNAAVALEIIKILQNKGYRIEEEQIREGLKHTIWPARFEVLQKNPLFILDGGHNPQCAQALTDTIRQVLPGRKVWFLTGVLADKDYEQIADLISPVALGAITITPDNPRALDAKTYAEVLRKRRLFAQASDTVEEGIDLVLQKAQDQTVVAFGSLYMAGAIRKIVLSNVSMQDGKADK